MARKCSACRANNRDNAAICWNCRASLIALPSVRSYPSMRVVSAAVAGVIGTTLIFILLITILAGVPLQTSVHVASGDLSYDGPLAGATVTIYTLDGKKVFEEKEASRDYGSFMVSVSSSIVNPFPEDFKIVATEGTLNQQAFTGSLTRVVLGLNESKLYHVNEVTTLIAAYFDRHPDLGVVGAEEAVKRFLAVPSNYDIVAYAEYNTMVYSPTDFYWQCQDAGGLTVFIDQLVSEMESGVEQHLFSTLNLFGLPSNGYGESVGEAYKNLAVGLTKGIAEKFGGPVGGAVAGWVISDIFGIKNAEQKDLDEIKQRLEEQSRQLNEIRAQLDSLKNQLDNLEEKLSEQLQKLGFTEMTKEADTAVDNIKIRHDLLIAYSNPENVEELKEDEAKYADVTYQINKLVDEITSTDAGTWNDLNRIHENLVKRPGTWGMIDLWSQAKISSIKKTHVEREEGIFGKTYWFPQNLLSLTDQEYQNSWSFYNKYLMAQLQGYTLLIEAYHARNDIAGAKTALARMNQTITEQVLQLRTLVEQEMLWLHRDSSAHGLFQLYEREFPAMEVRRLYWEKKWTNFGEVSKSIFEKLDSDIYMILGSMRAPENNVFFTARVLLSNQLIASDKLSIPPKEFLKGLPLTFQNYKTKINYTVTGTRINPDESDTDIWALRYEFQVPAGDYLLVKPNLLAGIERKKYSPESGWFCTVAIDEGYTPLDMSTGAYGGEPWIEVREDTATYWGGTWWESRL